MYSLSQWVEMKNWKNVILYEKYAENLVINKMIEY